jgi:hypothetical protein
MSFLFFVSELILAAAALRAAQAVRPRAPEAALGFALLGAAAVFGAASLTGWAIVTTPYGWLVEAGRIWGLPLVAVGWTLVFFGLSGDRPAARVPVPVVLLWLASALFGDAWRLVGGVGAALTVLLLATREHPIQPAVRQGAWGAGLVLLAGALGTEGTLLWIDRVVFFHLAIAVSCTWLAGGLMALAGDGEQR